MQNEETPATAGAHDTHSQRGPIKDPQELRQPVRFRPSPMLEARHVKELLTDLGIAININNGRCEQIEETLCRATTLCVELLAYFDNEDPRP